MAEGEMKKVSAWIPQETLNKLEEKGYHNRAEAIRLGLEYLLKYSNMEDIRNPKVCSMGDTKSLTDSIMEGTRVPMDSNGSQYELLKAKNEELERLIETERTYLKKEIERLTLALQESPNPVEFAQ